MPSGHHASMSFPSEGMQVLSSIVHFVGVSILAHCISRRLASENLSSWQGLAQMSWARMLILLVFIDSWLFLFVGGVIIFGAGLETNHTVCSLGIYLCIVFYASSKALIYAFLIEKVHVVWAPIVGSRRLKSPVYIGCFTTMLGYVAIIILMFIGKISYFREDGVCMIGLHHYATIPLVVYDLFLNVLLTVLFLWPLGQSNIVNPIVRRVALRTLVASTVALATSAVNMLTLTLLHGEELGWVCLGSCGADVIANALALFWVSSSSQSQSQCSRPGCLGLGSPPMTRPEVRASYISAKPTGSLNGDGISAGHLSIPFPKNVNLSSHRGAFEESSRKEFAGMHADSHDTERVVSPTQSEATRKPIQNATDSFARRGERTATRKGSLGRIFGLFRSGSNDEMHKRALEVTITTQLEASSDYDEAPRSPIPIVISTTDQRPSSQILPGNIV